MRGFEFTNLKPAPQTVIKQYLPSDVTIKKVEAGAEIDDTAPDACDWVKHAKKIDAQINKPVEGILQQIIYFLHIHDLEKLPEMNFDDFDFTPNPAALIGWLGDLGIEDPEKCARLLNGTTNY